MGVLRGPECGATTARLRWQARLAVAFSFWAVLCEDDDDDDDTDTIPASVRLSEFLAASR